MGTLDNVLPDTGSAANLMGIPQAKKLGINIRNLRRPADALYAANGLPITAIGTTQVRIRHLAKSMQTTFIISDEFNGTILNCVTCEKLKVLTFNSPLATIATLTPDDTLERNPPTLDDMSEADLEQLKQQLLTEFADVFDGDKPLKPMAGPPMTIHLKDDAVPTKVRGPRPIPIPLRPQVKELLDTLEEREIIKKIQKPTAWVHPASIVLKASGKLRLTVDLRTLNKYVKRPEHPVRTPKDAVASVPPTANIFSTFDSASSYHQVPLAEECQEYTTFITPWGRYVHLRATMGLSCAGDEYNRRGDEALADLPNLEKVVDDVLLHDSNMDDHLNNVRRFLTRCRETGITLNPKKFILAKSSVPFAGYIVSDKGISADPNKIKAIADFPKPKNISDMRSFLGLVEQLAGFSSDISAKLLPLRPLLSTKSEFIWTTDHDSAFQEVKQALVSPPILTTFDKDRETVLQTDASRTQGFGYALLQKDPSEVQWKLIECGSRFITDAESRYAMVELELAGAVWAMKKCHNYLHGLDNFTLLTDHQPLVTILNKKTLDHIDNTRVQRLKSHMTPYLFNTVWRKGKEHKIADALSRAPVDTPTPDDEPDNDEMYGYVCNVQEHLLAKSSSSDLILDDLRNVTSQDNEYQELIQAVQHGFSDSSHHHLAHYKKLAHALSVDKGLVLHGSRIVIPQARRGDVLKTLHASHQGMERTLRRARQAVYWPAMTSDIKNMIEACEQCQIRRPSQPAEPQISEPTPSRPFQEIAADYCEIRGKHFLVMTDRLSGWPAVYTQPGNPTAKSLIKNLTDHFSKFGIPVRLFTDGGLQFTAGETQEFLKRWGVNHRLSTPHYPQSNGLAESAVKTVKALLLKHDAKLDSEEFLLGLLELRNTPRPHGLSPSEIVFGQPMRSTLPTHPDAFCRKWLPEKDISQTPTNPDNDQRNPKPLQPLQLGDQVRIQHHQTKLWDKTAKVVHCGPHRAYQVMLPSGKLLWRNRKFLKPVKAYTTTSEFQNFSQPPTEPECPEKPRSTKRPFSETPARSDSSEKPRRGKRVKFAKRLFTPSA